MEYIIANEIVKKIIDYAIQYIMMERYSYLFINKDNLHILCNISQEEIFEQGTTPDL